MAEVVAVCINRRKGVSKDDVKEALLIENHGIEGDAHAGRWHRQISLLGLESVEKMRKKGIEVKCGGFGENITTRGIALYELPIGTTLRINDVVLEVSQIGKVCHRPCNIFKNLGECILPKEGIFAIVKEGGEIKVGDKIDVYLKSKKEE